ncbi:MAG: hypothetical protein ACE5G0_12825 [Rhodothermales bacterium]
MSRSFLITLMIAIGIAACDSNPLPEFAAVTAVPSPNTDVNFKRTTARADLKGWSNAEVYLRFATTEAAVKSTAATEITNPCTEDGSIRNCTFDFPNGNQEAQVIFEDGATIFYQWFIDYRLPEGEDVATIESSLQSFSIVAPQSCVVGSTAPDESCPNAQVCGRDERNAVEPDPGTGTLAPTVCILLPPS